MRREAGRAQPDDVYIAYIKVSLTVSTSVGKNYHHGELRAALVEAALALLAADGADAVSLRAVARRVGVSAMAPYRHYPDKAALLAAVAVSGFEGLHAALASADAAAPEGGELVAQAAAYVGYATAHPALFRLMFGPKRMAVHAELAAAGASAYSVLAGRVTANTAGAGDVEARVLGCWSLVHGLAMLFLDERVDWTVAGAADEVARRVAAAMLK